MKYLVLIAILLLSNIALAKDPVVVVWLNQDCECPRLVYCGGSINDEAWLDCAVGKIGNDNICYTPTGEFIVTYKAIVREEGSVYGTRIIRLNYVRKGNHLCIHGTNHPELIPGYISRMCIRLSNEDIEWLYDIVKVGDIIDVVQ
jgi:hypothetical protein